MTPEEKKIKVKQYYEKNKEKILAKRKLYKKNNESIVKRYSEKYKENNKDKIKKYYVLNQDRLKEKQKQYHIDNPYFSKKYYEHNKDKIKCYNIGYYKNKLITDPLFKLKNNLRVNIKQTLNNSGFKKTTHTEQILGCTFEDFKKHLESKFEPWMTWENMGNPKDGILELNKTWDIDHIIPLSSAITEEELLKLCHYTNLQPLCSYTNRFIKRNLLYY